MNKVKTMEQIIIWGAGSVFHQNLFEIRRMLQDGVNIIALVDQGKKGSVVDGYRVIDKQEIGNYNWDKILVAADKAYDSIREDIRKMRIDEGKVESLTHYLEKDYSLITDRQVGVIKEILRASDNEIKNYEWMYRKIAEYGVFPFEQNVGCNHNDIFWSALGVCQTIEEFTEFCNYISGLTIETAIEIGVFRGRSSYLMCALLARKNPDLQYVLVDIKDNLKEYDRFKEILPWLDKRIPSTSDDYKKCKFDFVFIDADHSYTASYRDYLNCGQYANKLTVFHDIYCHEYDKPDGGTVRMWEEVLEKTKEQEHIIFSSHNAKWMGIGVIEWKNDNRES
ncbi:MAG: class I SAM-dependent methyltransferase [Lachnospiraceae bacterium]|nr:class I SAM-dependent methyltransferase [Lachnospiraceae bacterium]